MRLRRALLLCAAFSVLLSLCGHAAAARSLFQQESDLSSAGVKRPIWEDVPKMERVLRNSRFRGSVDELAAKLKSDRDLVRL